MLQQRIRAVFPELPDPSAWLGYLQPALEANWFTNYGPVNTLFEDRISALYGRSEEVVITASNATAGLSACLIGEAISGPVLCPAFTFQATAAAILGANCKPVIVDVDPISGVVTPETLEAGFRETGARAAIVLAPYGISIDFRAHEAVCRDMNRLLIIDNAAGLGVPRAKWAPSGEGEVVREVYSLHATKPFGIGEGGAIFAPRSKEASLRAAMNFGLQTHSVTGTAQPPFWGINGKLSEVHAAIGLAVADEMAKRVGLRQDMAARWCAHLENTTAVIFSTAIEDSPWQVFPIMLESQKNALATVELAASRGIELRRYYTPSLGACSGMAALGPCPNAQSLADRAVTLPVRSTMSKGEQDALMTAVRDCIVDAQKRSDI